MSNRKGIKREIEAVTDQTCEPCKTAKEDVPTKIAGLEKAEFKDVDYYSDRGKELEKQAGEEFKGTPYFRDCIKNEDGSESCRTFTGYDKDKTFKKMTADNYLSDLEVDET